MNGAADANPFPGLRPFEAEEDHLFFGREARVDELLRRLRFNRFLAVVGTSLLLYFSHRSTSHLH